MKNKTSEPDAFKELSTFKRIKTKLKKDSLIVTKADKSNTLFTMDELHYGIV